MIIDVHNHIGLSRDGGHGKVDEVLQSMEECKISMSVLFAVDEEGYQPTYEIQNDKVLAAQNKYPDRIIAFTRIVPSAGKAAVKEFERCCALGAKGLKLKTCDGFEPSDAKVILDVLGERRDFPVLIHTSHDEHSQPRIWQPVVAKYPGLNFILAHGGKDHYRKCTELAIQYPNVYVDTSTLSYYRTQYIYENAGPEKLLFASDYPYSHPEIELKKIQLAVTKKDDLELVLFKNAARLLGLKGEK